MALPPFFDPIVNAPRPQKLVAGVAGLIIIAAAGYFLLLAPAQEQVTQLRDQLTTLQREVERNRAIVADLVKYRREVVELEARLNALKDRLPGEKEIPTLYRTLTDAAAAAAEAGRGAGQAGRARGRAGSGARGKGCCSQIRSTRPTRSLRDPRGPRRDWRTHRGLDEADGDRSQQSRGARAGRSARWYRVHPQTRGHARGWPPAGDRLRQCGVHGDVEGRRPYKPRGSQTGDK